MKRKFASIGLIVLLLGQGLGIGLAWIFVLHAHHEAEAFEKEKPENLVVFNFEADDEQWKQLEWMDKREFRLNGKMYDLIATKTTPSGGRELICYQDEKESHIRAAMAMGNGANESVAPISNNPTFQYVVPQEETLKVFTSNSIQNGHLKPLQNNWEQDIATPPPKS